MTNDILEEEMIHDSKSDDVNIAAQKICYNYKNPGHAKGDYYSLGGGKEGQGPKQISRQKREEAEKKKYDAGKIEQDIQVSEFDVFGTNHMALDRTPEIE